MGFFQESEEMPSTSESTSKSPEMPVIPDIRKRWYDENGILNIGILDFLLDDTIL